MRLTIIADDGCICLNGVCRLNIDMPQLDFSIHAVQWYGEFGEIEYRSFFVNGVIERAKNKYITDISEFEWAVTLFNTAEASGEDGAEEQVTAAENQPTSFGTQEL